ncbi:hypothetical protein ABZZ20_36490 [Streptomyces sp. NPDC006430]
MSESPSGGSWSPDALHLAEVFGLDEKTAIRYANSARALLDQAAEQPPQ